MPWETLDSASIEDGDAIYLDTSAIYALAASSIAQMGFVAEADDVERAKRISEFCGRAPKARLQTSVLAVQELAYLVRRNTRASEALKAGFGSWRGFKEKKPTESKAADQRAQTVMLQWLVHLKKIVAELNVAVVWADDAEDEEFAVELRDGHHDFLRKHRTLDSMDALHLALGVMLGAEAFVSFDNGWANVAPRVLY